MGGEKDADRRKKGANDGGSHVEQHTNVQLHSRRKSSIYFGLRGGNPGGVREKLK